MAHLSLAPYKESVKSVKCRSTLYWTLGVGRPSGGSYAPATVKAEKEEALTHFALGVRCMPTGYEKSFCYQALRLVFDCLRNVEKKGPGS